MPTPLKDLYSPAFYETFSDIVIQILPDFDKKKFIELIFDKNWKQKELKERMKHTSLVLNKFLPSDFEKAAEIIVKIISKLQENNISESALEYMFFPDYIENFGIENFETSVKTFENITQFTSCEFAVRPFIIKYGEKMMSRIYEWSLHKNLHVRRLASEGSRSRLPWAIALPAFKKDPAPILPILENLINDSSEYVRRSVANNLNDISKDNPQIVIEFIKKFRTDSKQTNALIKHACRTLLKQGNPEILEYFDLNTAGKIQVSDFHISNKKVKTGEYLSFSFYCENISEKNLKLRSEYALYFLRNNGKHSKKVFKISEKNLNPNEKIHIEKKHSFRKVTTRKYYVGVQKLSVIVNGTETETKHFELSE